MAKVDSKGRVLIPISIRKKMGIDEGTELILIPSDEKKEARILPLNNGRTQKCSVVMTNQPRSMSNVMEVLDMMNINILMSESRNLLGNGSSEWTFILDTSELTTKPGSIEERLSRLEGVKSVNIKGK
jgi:AbrB family looped-hinge helix DNA binding protein